MYLKKNIDKASSRQESKTKVKGDSPDRLRVSAGGRVSESQTHISCDSLVVNAAVDTLIATYDACVEVGLIERLAIEKKRLQDANEEQTVFKFGSTDLFSFNLQRTGAKLYQFILKSADVTVCISTRKQGSTIPNLQLSIGSISSQSGVLDVVRRFKMWCRHHGITLDRENVSRLDVCADIALPIRGYSLENQDRHITRAEKLALHYSNRKLTGLQVGKGDIVLRIYDKLLEMSEKMATAKEEFFTALWGPGVNVVTRFEFQLRSGALRSMLQGPRTISRVVGNLAGLWDYLTKEWFRHTDSDVDRENKNQSRSESSEIWKTVQQAFESFEVKEVITRTKKQVHVNLKALLDQATGIMLSVIAAKDYHYQDCFGMISGVSKIIQDEFVKRMFRPDFEKVYLSRRNEALLSI